MSAGWDAQALLEPVSAEQPCGQNLDEAPILPGGVTPVLAEFDALRLFGQARSPEAPPDPEDRERENAKVKPPIEWDRLRDGALEALHKTKDLRLLAYLGTALLRTDGLPAFARTLTTASQWIETYWAQVYPLVDEDAMARRNALNCFADPMAVVDRVWRLPLVTSRQHGRFSLRDFDIATGQVPASGTEPRPDERAMQEAFRELSLEALTALEQSVTAATAALNSIDERMRGEGGPEVAPDFTPLLTQFAKLNRICRDQLAQRGEAAAGGAAVAPAAGAAAGCHPRPGCRRGVLPAQRAVEPYPDVRRTGQAAGGEGFSPGAGRYCPGRARRRALGGRHPAG